MAASSSQQSPARAMARLVFTVVDRDRSGNIDRTELLDVLKGLNFAISPELMHYINDNCNNMTIEGLEAVFKNADGVVSDDARRSNLGMLCGSLPLLGAISVRRDKLDAVLGENVELRSALQGLGFAPEGVLGPAERSRLYAALWNNMAGGAWRLPLDKLEQVFTRSIAAMIAAALFAAVELKAVGDEEARKAADRATAQLNSRKSRIFSASSLEGNPGLREKLSTGEENAPPVPFPVVADAFEALVQFADGRGSFVPASLLLWRLYLLLRVREGFPAGAPHSVEARSGFGFVSKDLLAGVRYGDTSNTAVAPMCEELRYASELCPTEQQRSTRHADGPIAPSHALRAWAQIAAASKKGVTFAVGQPAAGAAASGAGGNQQKSVSPEVTALSLLANPEAVVAADTGSHAAWVDVRWSSSYARAAPPAVQPLKRSWWSAGAVRVLDLRADEEDVAKLPSLAKTALAAEALAQAHARSGFPRGVDRTRAVMSSLSALAFLDPSGLMTARAAAWLRTHTTASAMGPPTTHADSGDQVVHPTALAAAFLAAPVLPPSKASASSSSSSSVVAATAAAALQPRSLPWLAHFESRLELDPTGDAAVARWLFQVLQDPSFASSSRQGVIVLAEPGEPELVAGSKDRENLEGIATTPWSKAVLEAGGPPLASLLMGLWYRACLEAASVASARLATDRETVVGAVDEHLQVPARATNDPQDRHVRVVEHDDDMDVDGEAAAKRADAWTDPSEPLYDALRVIREGQPSAASAHGDDDDDDDDDDDHAATTLTWWGAMESVWPVVREDVVYAAYSLCFPQPAAVRRGLPCTWEAVARVGLHHRRGDAETPLLWDGSGVSMGPQMGQAASREQVLLRNDRGTTRAATTTPSSSSSSSSSSAAAAAASSPSSSAGSLASIVEQEQQAAWEAQKRPAWEGSDPFDEDAVWVAFRPRAVGAPPLDGGSSASEALAQLSKRGPGRVSVMRWLLAASAEPRAARRCGLKAAASGMLAEGHWLMSVVLACWAAVKTAAGCRITHSPYGQHFGRLRWGKLTAAQRSSDRVLASVLGGEMEGFVADVVAVATGVGKLAPWRERGAGGVEEGAVVKASDVRDWARKLVGQTGDSKRQGADFAVGWDTVLALSSWLNAELPLPHNAGALVDEESTTRALLKSEVKNAESLLAEQKELRWCSGARGFAVLVALSQVRSPAVRHWAAAAKRAWYTAIQHPARVEASGGDADSGAAMSPVMLRLAQVQSALWRELFFARRDLAPARLDVPQWSELTSADIDSTPGRAVGDGRLCLFSRLLWLLGSDCDELLRTLQQRIEKAARPSQTEEKKDDE